jgi:tetratricopeptide (TPR) repeat protein
VESAIKVREKDDFEDCQKKRLLLCWDMNTILKYYLRVVFLLFPIAFIPIILDSFGFGKNLSLMIMAFLALILWTVKLVFGKEKIVKTNKLFWLFLIFTVWSVVSFFRLDSGLRMQSLMSPMGMGTVGSLFILFFVWLQVNDKEEGEKQFLFLTISGLIVGIVSLIVFMLPANKLPLLIPKENPLISIGSSWSLVGSILGEVTLLIFLVFGWLKKLLVKIKEKAEVMNYLTDAVAVTFFSLLSLLGIYRIFKLGWGVLDGNSAWVIAVEAFKRSPIFGVGIGNFSEAFNMFRPASYNLTQYWTNVFYGSSMGILQIWTELGVVGLILTIYLVLMVLKLKKTINFWQIVLFLAVVLFLPLNLMSVFLLGWLLSTNVWENKESKLILNVGENNFNVMPYLVGVLILGGVAFGSFWSGKMFLGDFYMRKSLLAAAKNDGVSTYELQIKAVGSNPNVASYRKMYSQTNLALTQSLLSQEEISDEDKEKASTLVQQAVREAKAAISLNERNPEYWYNLAGMYKSLVGMVDGSADWSYQAYQQAIILDPTNPILYLDMGGLFYAAGNYEQADRAFEEAVVNKNDFANAWYNWANSAKKLNKIDVAVARLEQALKLVPADSGDYETAAKELETWKKELEEALKQQEEYLKQQQAQQAEQKQPETLKTPEPLPTVGEEEKVNVPAEELQPPVVEPTVEPEPPQP